MKGPDAACAAPGLPETFRGYFLATIGGWYSGTWFLIGATVFR